MALYYLAHKAYAHIPNWALKAASGLYYAIPEAKRYGPDFAATYAQLAQTEYISRAEMEELINQRFLHTFRNALENVPYYRKRYQEYGIGINTVKDIRDITQLPIIDKEEVRNHQREMISEKYDPVQLMYCTTSGSTGSPLGFYQPKQMVMIEWAYVMHIWKRVGCLPSSSRLVLRGKKLHGNTDGKPYFYDPLRRELSCDIFQLTEKNLESYCQAIEKYKPEYIHGYMSAITILANYVEARGLKHQFQGILAVSETVYPNQRAYVEKVFHTRVFSFYGHSERLVIAGECEKSSCYHVEPLYGYCEILNRYLETNDAGEIVSTGFLNEAMPLIRYRTGDAAAWKKEACECGRQSLRLDGVEGRWNQDMLVNREGALVSLAALNIHSDEFDHLVRYKLIQNEPGFVRMEIQPTDKYTDQDGQKIKELLEQKTGGKIQFAIHTVRSIPIMRNGKYCIVEQKIPDIMRGGVRCKLILLAACFPVRKGWAA